MRCCTHAIDGNFRADCILYARNNYTKTTVCPSSAPFKRQAARQPIITRGPDVRVDVNGRRQESGQRYSGNDISVCFDQFTSGPSQVPVQLAPNVPCDSQRALRQVAIKPASHFFLRLDSRARRASKLSMHTQSFACTPAPAGKCVSLICTVTLVV